MNIQDEKLEIMKMVMETENPDILESIKNLLRKESTTNYWGNWSEDKKGDIVPEIEDPLFDEPEDFDEFIKKYGR